MEKMEVWSENGEVIKPLEEKIKEGWGVGTQYPFEGRPFNGYIYPPSINSPVEGEQGVVDATLGVTSFNSNTAYLRSSSQASATIAAGAKDVELQLLIKRIKDKK